MQNFAKHAAAAKAIVAAPLDRDCARSVYAM
jgi:hypothetical protein